MKNQTTFFLLFLLLGYAQVLSAQNFGGPGEEWYYSGHNAAPPAYSGYIHFRHTGDTVLEGRQANLLLQQHYAYTGVLTDTVLHIIAQTSDTVFLYRNDLSAFVVLFVFNRLPGDTLILDTPLEVWAPATYRIVIDSVSVENYGGMDLKKYHTRALDNFLWQGGLLDKIGCMGWFFPVPVISIPEGPGEIRCYSSPQLAVNFRNYACDYTLDVSTHDPVQEFNLNVFPNPSTGQFTVISEEPIVSLRVMDLSGRTVLETRQHFIEADALLKGFYVLQVSTQSGKVQNFKINKM